MSKFDIVKKALKFATKAHKDQVRKYTQEPYINHPIAVSKIVKEIGGDKNMRAAAFLHDVVEDTNIALDEILINFGHDIFNLVSDLTDISKKSDGIRKIRKELDRQHLSRASKRAKTIKLADLINNTVSIVLHDSDFAKVYMSEKRALLEVLRDGNHILYQRALQIVKVYYLHRKDIS